MRRGRVVFKRSEVVGGERHDVGRFVKQQKLEEIGRHQAKLRMLANIGVDFGRRHLRSKHQQHNGVALLARRRVGRNAADFCQGRQGKVKLHVFQCANHYETVT